MMRSKLGLLTQEKEDPELIRTLLKWMHHTGSDYTNTFRDLMSQSIPEDKAYQSQEFKSWWQCWQDRLNRNDQSLQSSLDIMRSNNPVIIPRNHHVEAALSAAEEQFDLTKLQTLLQALSTPYEHKHEYSHLYQPPKPEERIHQTFCGT